MNINELTTWSDGKEVTTKQGPRILRKGPATAQFWAAWRADKEALKRAGISCAKDRDTEEWTAMWWQPLPTDIVAQRAATVEASRAEQADDTSLPPPPAGLSYLPFQAAGIRYVQQFARALIADEMGLGKTIQAIGVINCSPEISRVLIVCPASLKLNWARELRRWLTRPLSIGIANGGTLPETQVCIINYDILVRHRDALLQRSWDLIVADEAHRLKNPKAQRTRALLGGTTQSADGTRAKLSSISADRWLFLTGTPILNRPVEIWPIAAMLDPQGAGKSWWKFVHRYCAAKQTRFGLDVSGASNLDELQRSLREHGMIRRLKADVLKDLPPKRRTIITLPAAEARAAVQEEIAKFAAHAERIHDLQAALELARAGANETDYHQAVEALREGQSAAFAEMSKVRHELALRKAPAAIEYLQDAAEQGPVVVFVHHKDVGEMVAQALGTILYCGDTSVAARQALVDDFQAGNTQVFVGTIGAAGVGITLTRSSHVVFVESSWVPADLAQAEDRCHRIGTDTALESIAIEHLVFDGSLDCTMLQRVLEKEDVISSALDRACDAAEQPELIEEVAITISDSELKAAAERTYSVEMRVAALMAMRTLAVMCDGAARRDGSGFNKVDAPLGHRLAHLQSLSSGQIALACKLATRYQRQLPPDLLQVLGITSDKKRNINAKEY